MISAAALLVLVGLGLFVGGILTGTTLFYWACVAACVAAGVFLVLARVRMGRAPADAPAARGAEVRTATLPAAVGSGSASATAGAAPPAPEQAPATDEPAPAAGRSAADEPPAPAWERTASRGWEPDEPAPPAGPAEAAPPRTTTGPQDLRGDPPVEEVEVTDLLVVVDLHDEVLVVDEHPRYHLAGCRWLRGRDTIPLPLDEARTDGFTPCGWCAPDRTLAERERARR